MAKKKQTSRPKFRISVRFDAWIEREIDAVNLEQAVAFAANTEFEDVLTVCKGAELSDCNRLPGTGAYEVW